MPEKGYFLRMTGAILLGLVALVIAAVAFIILLPFILALALGVLFVAFIFIVLWAVVYFALMVGVAIYYFFRPMEWEEKDKGYSITETSESGMRERGDTKTGEKESEQPFPEKRKKKTGKPAGRKKK